MTIERISDEQLETLMDDFLRMERESPVAIALMELRDRRQLDSANGERRVLTAEVLRLRTRERELCEEILRLAVLRSQALTDDSRLRDEIAAFAEAAGRWLSETGEGMRINTATGRSMTRKVYRTWLAAQEPSPGGGEMKEGDHVWVHGRVLAVDSMSVFVQLDKPEHAADSPLAHVDPESAFTRSELHDRCGPMPASEFGWG